MTKETAYTHNGWPRIVQVLALLFTAFIIFENVDDVLWVTGLHAHRGDIGLTLSRGDGQGGFVKVLAVADASSARAAGIAPGDRIALDHPWYARARLPAGYSMAATLDHNGMRRHVVIRLGEKPRLPIWQGLATGLPNLLGLAPALFGAFILWRGRGRPATLMLGLGFAGFSLNAAEPQLWLSDPRIFLWVYTINGLLAYVPITIWFYAFALLFYRETTGRLAAIHKLAFAAYATAEMLCGLVLSIYTMRLDPLPVVGNGFLMLPAAMAVGFLAAFAYMVASWRRSPPERRQRHTLMLAASALVVLSQIFATGLTFMVPAASPLRVPLNVANVVLGSLIPPALFTYAIFRHKVLDLGFAINRTLVYGILSSFILLAFGLAEWGIEKLLPESVFEGHSELIKMLVEAGIALAIFLAFHRLRDFVEHHVEKLFFREWHEKEAALKRFVAQASFTHKREALVKAFAAELGRFGDGVQAAVYLKGEDGQYHRGGGTLAGVHAEIDADDPALVVLRAEPRPLVPYNVHSALPAALAVPMAHRGQLTGFILLAAKPSGLAWRPDECEVLAWAAHQVGLDLYALKVEALEKAVAMWETRYNERVQATGASST